MTRMPRWHVRQHRMRWQHGRAGRAGVRTPISFHREEPRATSSGTMMLTTSTNVGLGLDAGHSMSMSGSAIALYACMKTLPSDPGGPTARRRAELHAHQHSRLQQLSGASSCKPCGDNCADVMKSQ